MKKIAVLLFSLLSLTVSTLIFPAAGAVSAAAAGEDIYTVVVKFYDDVMLKYTTNYPNGGIWTGNGCIPIGGTEISDQVYCVDPFIPFHSVADTTYPGGVTTDTMYGYAAAAPWTASAPMLRNADAVRWLILNGYRGDYMAKPDDAESVESVARLKRLSGGDERASQINKKIALMATKIAIWKVLAGDQVVILDSSLAPAQKPILDWLVGELVKNAKSDADTGLSATGLEIEITADGVPELHPYWIGGKEYLYFGPMRVNAKIANPYTPAGDEIKIDKVFLSASGAESSDIFFASDIYGTLVEKAQLYGSAEFACFIDGGTTDGFVWSGGDFYVFVPADRAGNVDMLTIHALAGALSVPLASGTPVTFVYQKGVAHDWNFVQAYAGAARVGARANLYAHAQYNTGNTPLGGIGISKHVLNGAPGDSNLEFKFRLLYSTDDTDYRDVNLSDYPVIDGVSVDYRDNTITLKDGRHVYIHNLPASWHYKVVETGEHAAEFEPYYEIQAAPSAKAVSGYDFETEPFKIDAENAGFAYVRFTNRHLYPNRNIYVGKAAMYVGADGPVIYRRDEPYVFQLQKKADGEGEWTPADLRRAELGGGGGAKVFDEALGLFSLNSQDMIYIGLEQSAGDNFTYRVVEFNRDADFMAGYAMVLYDGYGMYSEKSDGMRYVESEYATDGFRLEPGCTSYTVISNVKFDFAQIALKKLVNGAQAKNSDNERDAELFPFRLFYLEEFYEDTPPPWALPLSTTGVEYAFFVSGVPEDRITPDSDGNPTVIWLANGDTALISGLPKGKYMACEYEVPGRSGDEYKTSYVISGNGGSSSVGDAARYGSDVFADSFINHKNVKLFGESEGRDAAVFFTLTDNAELTFINTKNPTVTPGPNRPDVPGTPPGPVRTPSGPDKPKFSPTPKPSPTPMTATKRTPRPPIGSGGDNGTDEPADPNYDIDKSLVPGDMHEIDRPREIETEYIRTLLENDSPQTGDANSPAAVTAAFIAGSAMMAVSLRKRKRKSGC